MRRQPVRYTLWLARNGASPRSISLPVWVPVLLLLLLLAWSGVNLYLWNRTAEMRSLEVQLVQLSQQARDLTLKLEKERSRNQNLTNDAQKVLANLKSVETQINTLRQKVGMPKIKLVPARLSVPGPKGGAAAPVAAESLFATAATQIGQYSQDLQEVAPEVDGMVRRKASTPSGYPVRGHYRVTSSFGNRSNPFGWGYEFHDGLDFPAPTGTLVRVTAPGQVVQVGWNGPFGLSVTIDHGYGYRTLYGHLSRTSVQVGAWLQDGEALGQVGSTGRSTGPHLHYSLYRYGVAVNPAAYLR